MEDEMLKAFQATLQPQHEYEAIRERMRGFIDGWRARGNNIPLPTIPEKNEKRTWSALQRRKFAQTMAAKKKR